MKNSSSLEEQRAELWRLHELHLAPLHKKPKLKRLHGLIGLVEWPDDKFQPNKSGASG